MNDISLNKYFTDNSDVIVDNGTITIIDNCRNSLDFIQGVKLKDAGVYQFNNEKARFKMKVDMLYSDPSTTTIDDTSVIKDLSENISRNEDFIITSLNDNIHIVTQETKNIQLWGNVIINNDLSVNGQATFNGQTNNNSNSIATSPYYVAAYKTNTSSGIAGTNNDEHDITGLTIIQETNGNHYDATSGVFTAPHSGLYHINYVANIYIPISTSNGIFLNSYLKKLSNNGNNWEIIHTTAYTEFASNATPRQRTAEINGSFYLNVGDKIKHSVQNYYGSFYVIRGQNFDGSNLNLGYLTYQSIYSVDSNILTQNLIISDDLSVNGYIIGDISSNSRLHDDIKIGSYKVNVDWTLDTTTNSTLYSPFDLFSTTYNNALQFKETGFVKGAIVKDFSNIRLNFTGQHRCITSNNININHIGLIVSTNGKYLNLDNNINPTINDSLPICNLTNIENSKKVFGVISNIEETQRIFNAGNFITPYTKTNINENRFYINSIGEGAIWVTNKNGNLENGDYITSSNIVGYGQKQILDEGTLKNFTVAKITCDCSFDLTKLIKKKVKTISDNCNNQLLVYDENGNIQYIDDLDSNKNIIYDYNYNTRFVDLSGNILANEDDYNTRLTNGENVYIACFVGCTYHCG